jgi:hypothetical protein
MTQKLRPGDWVEVKSKDEILGTLDSAGRLEGLPFMPEMFGFCGKKFKVYKRAHKTCDYTSPHPYHVRRVKRTVHLETRCDGKGHDGCQAGCLILWKEAWLKISTEAGAEANAARNIVPLAVLQSQTGSSSPVQAQCSESDVWSRTQLVEGGEKKYVCQATETPRASTPLSSWDVRQYWEDYWSGNVGLRRIVAGGIYSAYFHLSQTGVGLGRPLRWLYNKFHWAWGGPRFPRTPGTLPKGGATPTVSLNLQPGEMVRVKSHEEILKTVDSGNKNRGMYWDAELVPYCGGTYRVLKRVTRLIDERTGKMLDMKTPCIILDSVVCQARYSQNRMFCPKAMYPYWREIWLERADSALSENEQEEKLASVSEG